MLNPSTPVRILLIEDNVHYATTLLSNLEIEGFVVDIASNVAEGGRSVRALAPALVLLDIMLPGHSSSTRCARKASMSPSWC
jgi:DNA-binding response OmpR family regulator